MVRMKFHVWQMLACFMLLLTLASLTNSEVQASPSSITTQSRDSKTSAPFFALIPGNFAQVYPGDGQNLTTAEITDPFTFDWTVSENATSYIFYLEKDGIATPIVNKYVPSNSYTLTTAEHNQILGTGQYYWGITASNGVPADNLTHDAGFTVTQLPPGDFSQLFPGDGQTLDVSAMSDPFTFTWTTSEYATSYNFFLEKDGIPAPIVNKQVTSNSYTLTTAERNQILGKGQYYWGITASNGVPADNLHHDAGFIVTQLPPGSFSQLFPADGQTLYIALMSDPFTFTWTTSQYATSYNFFLEKDGIPTPIVNKQVTSNSYTLTTAERNQILGTGQYYWGITASNGVPADNLVNDAGFVVAELPEPGTFTLQTPANGATITDLSTAILLKWNVATHAETYALKLSNTSADLITAENLTPTADADALTCSELTCNYPLEGRTDTPTNGQYIWSVQATNKTGTTNASNNDFLFDIDIPAPAIFDLLSPRDGSSFDYGANIASFSWEASQPVDHYDLTVIDPSLNPLVLDDLTSAADLDALTCVATTCTLTVDGSVLFPAAGSYSWTVTASGFGGTTTSLSFVFDIAVLKPFNQLTPSNGTSITDITNNIELTWGVSGNAASYTLTLSRPTTSDVVLSNLTPLADADGLICDSTICTYTINNGADILENGIYGWIVAAKANVHTRAAANSPFTFTIAVSGPAIFTLLTPANTSTIDSSTAFTTLTWNEAARATSYLLTIDRPTLANYEIAGTAVSDSDPITCVASICAATVLGGVELAEEGVYNWNVSATGFGGTTIATGFTFTVDLHPQSFVLTSPANGSILTDSAAVAFAWTSSTNSSNYTLTVGPSGVSEASFTVSVAGCISTCLYIPTAAELAVLTNGIFTWTVTASDGATSVNASNAPFTFTMNEATDLVILNGSFEVADDSNLQQPEDWRASLVSRDRRICNKVGTPDGSCMYIFRGSPTENSRILQSINVMSSNIEAGDNVMVSFLAKASVSPRLRLQLTVFYTDGTKISRNTVVHTVSDGFEPYTVSISAEKAVKKIRVKLINTSSSGRIFVDDVKAVLQRSAIENGSSLNSVLPPPPAP